MERHSYYCWSVIYTQVARRIRDPFTLVRICDIAPVPVANKVRPTVLVIDPHTRGHLQYHKGIVIQDGRKEI